MSMPFFNLCFTYIKNSIKSRPVLYGLLFAMQIISFVCVFFVYGIIYHSYTVFENADSGMKYFEAEYLLPAGESEDDSYLCALDKSTTLNGMKKLLDFLGNDAQEVIIRGAVKTSEGYMTFSASPNLKGDKGEIRLPSDERYTNTYSVGDKINIADKELIIGEFLEAAAVDLSFYNMEDIFDDGLVYRIVVKLKEQPTYEYSQEMMSVIEEAFGKPLNIERPEALELLDEQLNSMQITVSAVLVIFVMFNCALFYKFIYSTKKNTLRIMRLCGATSGDCIKLYLSETLVHFTMSIAIAFLIFDKLIKRLAVKFYSGIAGAYTLKNYAFICLMIIVISLVIMALCIAPLSRRPIAQKSE